MKTVVSCNDKIVVWNNQNKVVTKVIKRMGALAIAHGDAEVITTYSGTQVQLSDDIVATPALGIDPSIEIWNIESGMVLLKINEVPPHYSFRFPFLNLEYTYGLNKVVDVDGVSSVTIRVFNDEGLHDGRQYEEEDKPEKQATITFSSHCIGDGLFKVNCSFFPSKVKFKLHYIYISSYVVQKLYVIVFCVNLIFCF